MKINNSLSLSLPKLLTGTKTMINLSKEIKLSSEIISIQITNPIEEDKILSISFTLFTKYSNYPSNYTMTYTIPSNPSNSLLTLLYLIKYTCPELYMKKRLITEMIYKPFLRVKFNYEKCILNTTSKLKAGVYAITPVVIQEKECFICGGYVFAIYQKNDLTYKNIIDNVWDECILSLALYNDNQLLTGYKSGKLRLWTIDSFHVIILNECYFNKFISSILAIYTTDIMIFFEDKKMTIWKELEEQVFSYECEEGYLIQCSTVYYDKETKINYIFIGLTNGKLKIIEFDKQHIDKTVIHDSLHEKEKGVYSLKYYEDAHVLFIGTKKGIQMCKVNKSQLITEDYFYLNAQISYIEYLIYKQRMFLFCCGNKDLHLINLKL